MQHKNDQQIHESFDIKNDLLDERIKLLRQKRYFSESESCSLIIDKEHYRVKNYSSFGVAIFNPSKTTITDELHNISFIYNDVEIAHLNLLKSRIEIQPDGNIIVAFEIVNDPINLDKLEAVNAANQVIQLQQHYIESAHNIPAEIKSQVYEIKDWLEHLVDGINQIEENINPTNRKTVTDYEETIITIIAEYLSQVFPRVLNKYAETLNAHSAETNKKSIDFLRQKLGHLIYLAPFSDRVFNKPLGYAGDYEMMNLIYKQENVGKSLFARCLHRYYINEPSAQAVRNRADYLVDVITKSLSIAPKGRPLRILSVACGPAMEWQKMIPILADMDQEIIVDLLDQDKHALLATQNQLRQLCQQYSKPFFFQFIHKAIKNIIVRGTEYKDYDLVYSAGLFDYLSDVVANSAGRKIFESVRPGGKLIIGNFNVNNPNQVLMDYALDWKLIYRSENDLLSLFSDVGGELSIEKEKLNLNLFCVIQKIDKCSKE